MTTGDDDVVDAATEAAEPNYDELVIGPPFAMSDDCELVQGHCTAVIQCPCGAKVRMHLLQPDAKQCPNCKAAYTHVLLVCGADNNQLMGEAFDHVLELNGIELPEADEGDAGDEGAAEVVNPNEDDA